MKIEIELKNKKYCSTTNEFKESICPFLGKNIWTIYCKHFFKPIKEWERLPECIKKFGE